LSYKAISQLILTMQTRSKQLLVVTEDAASITIPFKKNVVNVNSLSRIFPAIHELKPVGIVLDYDFIGSETEKVLRRLTSNPFYSGIKIYCYKSRPHTKVDGLLTVLGVKQFIYADTAKKQRSNITSKLFGYVLDGVMAPKLIDTAH